MYPDEHFIEKPVKKAMETFQEKLDELSKAIKNRNEGKKLPYYYLSPDRIPNSVAVWVCMPAYLHTIYIKWLIFPQIVRKRTYNTFYILYNISNTIMIFHVTMLKKKVDLT